MWRLYNAIADWLVRLQGGTMTNAEIEAALADAYDEWWETRDQEAEAADELRSPR